jgi:hypothetical protein
MDQGHLAVALADGRLAGHEAQELTVYLGGNA